MTEWRRICCAIDFSDPSRLALALAAELAQRFKAEMMLIHVRQETAGDPALFAPPQRVAADAGEEETLAGWVAQAERLAPGLVTSIELSGRPAEEIVRFAREFGCDAIVVGTHGRKGLGRVALGSVAEEVIRTADCAVVVARGPRSP